MAGKMTFGINLFTLRKQIATPQAFLETAEKLRDMGYECLQFSGAPYNPAVIREVSEKTGLPVVLTHMPLDRILNDTKALVAEHRRFGCERIGLGYMEFKGLPEEQILLNIAKIGEAARRVEAEGAQFFYHHHHHEFQRLSDGETIFDRIFRTCPEVNFTLDTFWLQAGGVSVTEYIEKCRKRCACVHLKDYLPTFPERKFVPAFAPVGDGNLNWAQIMASLSGAGVSYALVEEDDATDRADPLGEVGRSIAYLQKNFKGE